VESNSNRKLIRPEVTEGGGRNKETPARTLAMRRKGSPPEQTNAEEFYYLKQMAARTPMVLVLTDGEEIRGWIEWYDKACLKVNREKGPNLLVPKASIKYMFKESEGGGGDETGGNR